MIYNCRNLGGIRTSAGRTVKHGCLVRLAKLSEAEEADMTGISAVIDFAESVYQALLRMKATCRQRGKPWAKTI